MNNLSPKKMVGVLAKIIIVAVVLAFLGLQSLNFFSFTFPPEQWYYAYLGFGLTSGGVIAYLLIFSFDADTKMRKVIALGMLVVCVIGEILTAGFGMQVEAFKTSGLQLTESDFKFMVLAVQVLGLLHGAALVIYYVGDKVIELFADEDGDGIPNVVDKDWKPKRVRAFASETETNPTNERKQS